MSTRTDPTVPEGMTRVSIAGVPTRMIEEAGAIRCTCGWVLVRHARDPDHVREMVTTHAILCPMAKIGTSSPMREITPAELKEMITEAMR